MTLTYKFDPEDFDGFEKDLSLSDVKEYFKSLSTEEQIKAIEYCLDNMKPDDKKFIKDQFDTEEIASWLEEDFDYCADIFTECEDLFEDELHDFFEDEAYKEWRYEEEHKDPIDPYAQRGLRYSDFY